MLKLIKARGGLAGVEFAVTVPLLLTLLCGVTDLSRAIMTVRRLTVASASTAMIASTMAVQASSLNALSGQQAWQASTAPFATFPTWIGVAGTGRFSVTLSAVNFKASATPLRSIARVAWSVANPAGQPNLRACGEVTPAKDDAGSSLDHLPPDAFGATSLLVADVSTVFEPVFTSVFVGPLTLQRSGYVSPRINNGVALIGVFPGPSRQCPPA